MRFDILIVLVLIYVFQPGQCAKILGVLPFPKSHYILSSSLMRALAERGHDVTVISPVGEKNPPKNGTYRDIVLPGFLEEIENLSKQLNFFEKEDSGASPLLGFIFMTSMMVDWNEKIMKHPKVQSLIYSEEEFDVIIIEEFVNDCLKGLAAHFGAPLVVLSSQGANGWVNRLVGNPSPLSYIPTLGLDYGSDMTFFQRLNNCFYAIVSELINYLYLYPTYHNIIKKYIPNGPDLDAVLYNASIVLLNSHPSLQQAVPYVPSLIDIGGFHVQPPKKLPKDLQTYLDDAKEGVIYFSMGSNLRSADLPLAKREAILKSFGKLKQKVIWKWEEDDLPGKPDNVKLGKWWPQQDILAHPNVKLFITHGGLLSTTETVYHGVPILAIPIYGDQKGNAQVAVTQGYGLMLLYKDLNEVTLTERLNEALNNPKYGDTAKLKSKLFHDRPTKPMDTAVYWVEYVARYGGASHLRVAGLDLPWYKYHLLDVIAFLVLVSLGSLYLQILVLKKIFCKSKGKSQNVNVKGGKKSAKKDN